MKKVLLKAATKTPVRCHDGPLAGAVLWLDAR